MKPITTIAALALALGLSWASAGTPASAQPQPGPWLQPDLRNDKLMIDYREPIDPQFLNIDADDPKVAASYKKLKDHYDRISGIYERLKQRQVLERFSQFLAPLNLPVTLRLITKQCGPADDESNAYFAPDERSINLCYEYVRDFEDDAPKQTTAEGITRTDAIIGSVVSTMLHETGHAVYNLLRVPVLGREEDAADQIAAFIMVQFGRDIARTTVKGAAWKWYSRDWNRPLLWDEHSPAPQRLATYLCMAYGKDPQAFQDFVDAGWLTSTRAANCKREYEQALRAFSATILPHVDQAKMAKVLASPWLRPDELR
jgi:hypothetical protein